MIATRKCLKIRKIDKNWWKLLILTEKIFISSEWLEKFFITWKVSKNGVLSGPYFPHLDRIRIDTPYLSLFSPNAGKYGPEKTPYMDTFYAVAIKVSEKIWLTLKLKVRKKQDFSLPLKDKFLEKPQGEVKLTPGLFRVKSKNLN